MGMYYDDLPVGKIIKHEFGRTITEADNTFFSLLTMNLQPLHINEDFASKTEFHHFHGRYRQDVLTHPCKDHQYVHKTDNPGSSGKDDLSQGA